MFRGNVLAAGAGLDRGRGVVRALQGLPLSELRAAGQLDIDRCAVDASHVHAVKGGIASGRRRSTVHTLAPNIT